MSELNHKEKQILKKFRKSVSDVIQPHHDDKFLTRWLRARSWNPEAAEKMLRQSLLYRQKLELDDPSKTLPLPEGFSTYMTVGNTGYDKNGMPVTFWKIGFTDVVGFLQTFDQNEIIKLSANILDYHLGLAAKNGHHELVAIIDFENFSIRPYLSKAAADLAINLVKVYEANYPETLKICYVINAPRVFAIFYNMLKSFVQEATLKKIQVYRNDPPTWKKAILTNIDPGNLPEHYGGSLRDPDGNPKCLKLLPPGGKIPKEFYKNKLLKNSKKFYTEVLINNRDKLKLDFDIIEVGSLLKWDFCLEDNDIRFAITYKDKNGKTKTALEPKRIGDNQENESGYLECQTIATYTVIFDNSYSFFRSKKVFYEIVVSPPVIENFIVQ